MPNNTERTITGKIDVLAADPFAKNSNVTALKTIDGFRLRVGDWRVLYTLDTQARTLTIAAIVPPWRSLPMTTPAPPTITLGGEEYAVVPRAEYEALRNAVDEDAMDAAIIRRVLEDPGQELVPFELVKRIAGGEHPVRAWRDYRGMKAVELAASAGIAASYLSDIENGKKPGSVKAMRRIADALNVAVDDLI